MDNERTFTLWHGTVKHSADAIVAEGLKPNPEAAFRVNRIPDPCSGCTYLTYRDWQAKMFARFRSMYDVMQPGEVRRIGDSEGITSYEWAMRKRPDAQMPHVGLDETPTLLKFVIPKQEFDSEHWSEDFDSADDNNVILHGSLPPEYVKERLEYRGGEWVPVTS